MNKFCRFGKFCNLRFNDVTLNIHEYDLQKFIQDKAEPYAERYHSWSYVVVSPGSAVSFTSKNND